MEQVKPYAISTIQPPVTEGEPPAMLVLQFRDGRSTAISYSYLHRIDFNGVDLITLFFVDNVVAIRGRDLNAVLARLHRHSETSLTETDPLHAQSTVVGHITSIEVKSHGCARRADD
jgi:hypothetical protein